MSVLPKILGARRRWAREGPTVVGTVVDVVGSSYRKPGARILLGPYGRLGLVSGGCLERDLAARARSLTADGPCVAIYDTRADELHPAGRYGTGCDGVVTILLERLDDDGNTPGLCALASFERAEREGRMGTLATWYGDVRCGERALVWDDGESAGPDAQHLIAQIRRADSFPTVAQIDDGHVLIERVQPRPHLVIVGSGDDVVPLAKLAITLGWCVDVVSQRPSIEAELPKGAEHRVAPVAAAFAGLRIGSWTQIVLMTHDYDADAALLPAALSTTASWIGLLGPRRRTMRLFAELQNANVLPDPAALGRVETPVGLDLGAESPQEVALSVLSSAVAARNHAAGGRLRDRVGDIHRPHARLADDVSSRVA